jgi:hypothetical protein
MKFTVSHIPTAEEIASGNSRQTITIQPYGAHDLDAIKINISIFLYSFTRECDQLFTYSTSYSFSSVSVFDDVSKTEVLHNYAAGLMKAAELTDYLESIKPDVCRLIEERIQAAEEKRKEFERLDALEKEKDEVFGTKEANRIIREMHKKAKDKSYKYHSGNYIFVPAGLDKEPVSLYCASTYRGGNAYFFKGEFNYRIRRDVAIDIIANSSKAKTMFARLSN